MKEFFFSHAESHIYEKDLLLAKFWKELKQPQLNQIWDQITKASQTCMAAIKETE